MEYPIIQTRSESIGLSQSQVAEIFKLSPGRIAQIERKALAKIRTLLLADRSDVDLVPQGPAA